VGFPQPGPLRREKSTEEKNPEICFSKGRGAKHWQIYSTGKTLLFLGRGGRKEESSIERGDAAFSKGGKKRTMKIATST